MNRVTARRALAATLGLLCSFAVLAGCTTVSGVATPVVSTRPVGGGPSITDPATAGSPEPGAHPGTSTTASADRPTSVPASTSPQTSSDPWLPTAIPPLPPAEPATTSPATTSAGNPDPSGPTEPAPTNPPLTDSTPPATDGAPVTGSDGAGDPYYPTSGNGGYDVASYSVVLTYQPSTDDLTATNTIKASVTTRAPLARFDLDLQPQLQVDSVQIDGTAAAFTQSQAELVITPAAPLPPASDVTIVVAYHGKPSAVKGGTADLGDGGWYRTTDGGAVAAGEPYSASSWYPVDEHPSDTAAFSVTATVPDGWDVISNGLKFAGALPAAPAGMQTTRYDQKEAIASYLTTILIDKLDFTTDTFDGKPILNAFTSAAKNDGNENLAQNTAKILQVEQNLFGPFPFDSYGGIFTGQPLTFALETATRPVYANWVDLDTMIHETAHQWFGDDVTLAQWKDVCLNECFASYAPWLYHETVDGSDLDAQWKQEMAQVAGDRSFWSSPLVDMGAGNEFSAVYDRGPLALHALRHEMGDEKFFAMLKGWIATYGGKNASFNDFEAYASSVAGTDLSGFIDAWFRGTVVPPDPYRHPPGL